MVVYHQRLSPPFGADIDKVELERLQAMGVQHEVHAGGEELHKVVVHGGPHRHDQHVGRVLGQERERQLLPVPVVVELVEVLLYRAALVVGPDHVQVGQFMGFLIYSSGDILSNKVVYLGIESVE